MAAISSLGVGSNLDLTTLLDNLKGGEQAPLVAIQARQTSYTSKLSAYGQLNSALSALETASAALAKPESFQSIKATSNATDVLTATAASTAPSGTYAVNVTQLAQAQSLATAGVEDATAAIGGGELTIAFGTISGATADPVTGKYAGATFTADPDRTATSITIAVGSTMEEIRDAINGNVDIGVTASIVNDGSDMPNRLVLTSTQTGETSSMKITVAGDPDEPDNTALSDLLANDPEAAPELQLQQTIAAQNTKLTVNGIAITSATNSVEGAVQDVTMTVTKIGTSTLSVQKDTDSVRAAVTTFVNAYNNLQSVADKLTAYDANSRSSAALTGDTTLRNIQVRIRSALTSAQADNGSGLTMLSHIGVSLQKDGVLTIDPAKLTAALKGKLSGVENMFSGSDGVSGLGTQMSSMISGFTRVSTGTLATATKGINTTLDTLGKQYTATSERIDATMARYKAQFTQLDMLISTMNQTSSYLTQQFDAMNNDNSK